MVNSNYKFCRQWEDDVKRGDLKRTQRRAAEGYCPRVLGSNRVEPWFAKSVHEIPNRDEVAVVARSLGEQHLEHTSKLIECAGLMSQWVRPDSNNIAEVKARPERLFRPVFGTADPKITDKKVPRSALVTCRVHPQRPDKIKEA